MAAPYLEPDIAALAVSSATSDFSVDLTGLDERERVLLNALQNGIPVLQRPFLSIGKNLGMTEERLLNRIDKLREQGFIRQISAIFDSRRIGYQSSLAAMKIPADREEEAARIVNAHPGVSHNYRRDHEYNMWLTLTVHPAKHLPTEMELLAESAGAVSAMLLPTVKLFKINVQLDTTGSTAAAQHESAKPPPHSGPLTPLTVDDILTIRELQKDIDTDTMPYHVMADNLGINILEMLSRIRAFQADGRIRRIAAVLNHRVAGFTHNAMSVWNAPEDEIERCGNIIAGFKAVSHCYQRPTYPDWPYSLFGMIHARSEDEITSVVEAIRAETGLEDYRLLNSTREWKKQRVMYYVEEGMTLEEHLAAQQ